MVDQSEKRNLAAPKSIAGSLCASSVSRSVVSLLTLLGLACVVGCSGDTEPIRQYTINKRLPAALESSDRMVGAIIPHGDQVWFYKLAGPVDAVEFVESELLPYIEQIQFADGQPQIGELPSDWEHERQQRPMRFATLLLNTPSKQLELSISSLPKLDNWDEQIAMNVNRWRQQMGLGDSDERWAGATELTLAHPSEQPSVWIDLSGQLGAGPSMAGLSGAAGSLAAAGLPPDHPPVGGAAAARPADQPSGSPAGDGASGNQAGENNPGGGLEFTAPDDWRPGRMSVMRLAAFEFGEEGQTAELTIIQAGGDLRGNVARWLGEIRPEPPADDIVDAAMDTAEIISVSGREAFRYVLDDGRPDGAEDKEMTDATIVPLGDGFSMFIKARGPAQTIQGQHAAIGQFLQSLRLPEN